MLHNALRENKSEKYSESVTVPRRFSRVTCMLIFTPLHEINTQALRIHTVHFASRVIQHTFKLQLPLVVRCDGEVITFPARFQCHPIKLYIEISKAVFNCTLRQTKELNKVLFESMYCI